MSSDDDDTRERTVTKPQARVVPAPAIVDSEATVIRPASATVMQPPPGAPPPAPRHDSGNNLPIGTYLGEFEITELIGEGGFGIVYLARDHSLQRRVALKEYMPSALAARTGPMEVSVKSERHRETFEAGLKSFVNEARLLAQFDHPSLVKVYRFWEDNGTAYMVMPFYEGITLKQQLKDMGAPPNEAWLMELLGPLTEALEVIHADHCYHRDIAPDNVILLKGSNRPLLLDFGAARRVIGDMTQALTVILKPGYAPVEQYAEVPGMKQGPWTDVYALAAVVYYAITGKTPPTSVGRLMNDSYVPLVQAGAGRYSEAFLAAIDRALRVKPEERTQSIAEFRHDLDLDTMVPPPRPATTILRTDTARPSAASGAAAPASGGRSKTPLYAATGVLALVLLGGGLYVVLSPDRRPPPTAPQAAAPSPAPAASTVAAAPPPEVVPATPTAPAAAEPFDPVRELDRIAAAQTPGFGVSATPGKPEFRIGRDKVTFSVKSEREGYVSVLAFASDGQLYQLFPNSTVKTTRIKAGQTITLPPSTFPIDATGPEGPDEYLVIVSPNPRDFTAAQFDTASGLGILAREQASRIAAAHAGPISVFAGTPRCDAPCADEYGAARFTSRQVTR